MITSLTITVHVLMLGFSLAVVAGLFAALASVCSKLAFEEGGSTVTYFICSVLEEEYCATVVLLLRGFCFLSLFLCNALMWTLFVRALQGSRSTVEATVINSAANFFFTAIFGMLLFGESLSLLWWMGASLIVAGLVLIHHSTAGQDSTRKTQ